VGLDVLLDDQTRVRGHTDPGRTRHPLEATAILVSQAQANDAVALCGHGWS
jgi:hypothetical protein